ncbi:hypothetical protein QUB80_33490 [Chlorogloeopsis sp. ULAP01]|uniref:hypothetical protein n=1 Tax=Chlorogloeopsis sp. ULAP01 TaxID=3056483 RepID=UPI0025AB513D|nr:hypothetical protein [Chlorogloeopsis sp. ULAP01]MDM9385572.1 hypothetical protein [Chlorogloeopsis sp. ULAP01]
MCSTLTGRHVDGRSPASRRVVASVDGLCPASRRVSSRYASNVLFVVPSGKLLRIYAFHYCCTSPVEVDNPGES